MDFMPWLVFTANGLKLTLGTHRDSCVVRSMDTKYRGSEIMLSVFCTMVENLKKILQITSIVKKF